MTAYNISLPCSPSLSLSAFLSHFLSLCCQKRHSSVSLAFPGSKWSCERLSFFFFEGGSVKETLNTDKSANKLLQGARLFSFPLSFFLSEPFKMNVFKKSVMLNVTIDLE